jgi:hypothetical protein
MSRQHHTTPKPADHVDSSTRIRASYYFRMAIGIARFEDEPILAASRDKAAFFYGLFIWIINCLLVSVPGMYQAMHAKRGAAEPPAVAAWVGFGLGLVVMIISITTVQLLEYARCHWLTRLLFSRHGTFRQILRVLFLGSIVQWASVIPVAEPLIGGL